MNREELKKSIAINNAIMIGKHIEEKTDKCLSSGTYEIIESFFLEERCKDFMEFLVNQYLDKRQPNKIIKESKNNE